MTEEQSEKKVAKRYRCDICGKTYDEPGECCGEPRKDLLSSTCMGCQGCGQHL